MKMSNAKPANRWRFQGRCSLKLFTEMPKPGQFFAVVLET